MHSRAAPISANLIRDRYMYAPKCKCSHQKRRGRPIPSISHLPAAFSKSVIETHNPPQPSLESRPYWHSHIRTRRLIQPTSFVHQRKLSPRIPRPRRPRTPRPLLDTLPTRIRQLHQFLFLPLSQTCLHRHSHLPFPDRNIIMLHQLRSRLQRLFIHRTQAHLRTIRPSGGCIIRGRRRREIMADTKPAYALASVSEEEEYYQEEGE